MQTLHLNNDNVIELTGVTNGLDDSTVNTATVAVTLLDASEQALTGQAWPVTLAYVPNTAGTYRGLLSRDLALTCNQTVVAHVTAEAGGMRGDWTTPLHVIKRG